MQQLPVQSYPSHSNQTPPQTSHFPKIKPLLRRYYKEHELNEVNHQKSLKAHSKFFRAVKTNSNKRRSSSLQYIRGYMKNLKAQDSLSKLSYSMNCHACFENVYLLYKMRGLRNLTSLETQFFANKEYRIPLDMLFASLSHLKDLVHFKIQLNFYSFSEPQTLRTLFKNLRSLKKLASLSLGFIQSSNFEQARMRNLPKYISRLKQLQSLELKFERSRELTDQDIISLSSTLPKLPLLTQIKFDFGGFQVRIMQGSTLFKMFENMRNLSHINLILGSNHIISKEDYPLVQGLREIPAPSLKKLSLHFNTNLDNKNLIEFSQALKRFTSLSILHLDLSGCVYITNDSIAELSRALSDLIMLQSFSLETHRITETNVIIRCVASALKHLRNLVSLKLNLANIKTGSKQLQQLSESLANLSSLKFLDLSFSCLESFWDLVLESLSKSLRKLVHLKHLWLDFSSAKTVTNKAVEALANGVQELCSLSFLGLDFSSNEEIDVEAIEKIAQVLRHLPRLYSTNLRFIKCPKLKQNVKSLCSLFKALGEMENIREVALFLPKNGVNEQEVDILQQTKRLIIEWPWYE